MKKLHTVFTGIAIALLVCITSVTIRSQTVTAGFDVYNVNPSGTTFGVSPYAPTNISNYVTIVTNLTRGSGLTTVGSSAQRAWGATGWSTSTQANAIANSKHVSFVLRVKNGYRLSFASVNPFEYRRSPDGPSNGQLQYSVGSGFVDISPLLSFTACSGGGCGFSIPAIDLTSIGGLQNLTSTTDVTFRIVNWGAASGNGTWYIVDKNPNSPGIPDFAINGTLSEVPSNWYRTVSSGNWNDTAIWQSSATSGGTYLPALAPPTASASGVEIRAGHTVTLTASQTLNGTLNLNTGILNINGQTGTFNGTIIGTGSIRGSATSNLVVDSATSLRMTSGYKILKDFTVTGLVSLADTINISAGSTFGTVTATGTLNTGGRLIFKSDSLGTARVGSSTGTINGNVVVERYIPAKRAWRLLCAPHKTSTQTMQQAWQEGGTNPSVLPSSYVNNAPGYGTQITKTDSNDLFNGYDANLQKNPSVLVWAGNAWPSLLATTLPINTYPAYFLFVRGNRANRLDWGTNAPTSTTTLRTRGTLNQGNIDSVFTASAGQYVLVPNFYMSSIYAPSVVGQSVGLDPTTFTIWDPGINPYGGYITKIVGGMSAPKSNNYKFDASPDTIQSGQAFFVLANANNPTIKFRESDKLAVASSSVFARPQPGSVSGIYVNLYSSNNGMFDGVGIGLTATQTQPISAPKFFNGYEGIYLSRNEKKFVIESVPVSASDTFFLEFVKLKQQSYELEVSKELLDIKADVWLRDNFLQRDTLLTEALLKYPFTVTTDTFSFKKRFQLIIKKIPEDTIPVIRNEKFSVYPNPVREVLTIQRSPDPLGEVRIYNAFGIEVMRTRSLNDRIDCSTLPSGAYILKVGNYTTKFIKLP